ncbi:ATP-dependent dethiobiotin synthetase BioD [Calidifontibacter sp. DB0510]|uniref:ATP-dependent dethiobiotin synthetase BioD n=1 Tax=Metallococcus carri TaxID=1656884 RepID=A0A967B4Q9_9MICO|nr:dethiobiotin synthase [Metallococcus carri]NHN57250.1 ATP-dependent dethiobiotin synthetase BioD [Metallococcus carri]NOP37947.1 ATP-dependent dethiobiotin synthetase BioD [Calidifontibacter sp. DB2511S]
MTSVLCITGTDTEIGKTITTAAIAAALRSQGQRVLVVKLAQTGMASDDDGDVAVVRRLAGPVDVEEFVRLPEPLAPDVAARRAGVGIPTVEEHAARVAEIARAGDYDVILAEGSGGLLVRLDLAGGTLADFAITLWDKGVRAGFVVVCREGLGTLNHTALTLEALERRRLDLVGVVIGAASAEPDLAAQTNVEQLRELAGGQLLGAIPAGAADLAPDEFQAAAPTWIHL